MISLKDFSIGYDDRVLIQPATLDLPSEELTALIGRNGSGKSTLLRAIANINKKYQGSIIVAGENPLKELSNKQIAQIISFVNTDRTRIPNMTAFEVVSLGRSPYTDWIGNLSQNDKMIVSESLEKIGMADYSNRTLDTMSDGECQRVMIARALAQDTPIIILDEPTSFLDLPSRYSLVELLLSLAHDSGKTILFSTHELDIAMRLTDNILLLSDERLALMKSASEKAKESVSNAFGLTSTLNYF